MIILYDQLGGGFARYSTDRQWKVPHFEKMLYDNAQLALVYLHAYLITGNSVFRSVCESTLEFIQRELTSPEGGFYSSLDADSDGGEGKYYLWAPTEIRAALSDQAEAEIYLAAYGVTSSGNFEGSNVLHRVMDVAALAEQFGLSANDVPPLLERLNSELLSTRQARLHPGTDDKVVHCVECVGAVGVF